MNGEFSSANFPDRISSPMTIKAAVGMGNYVRRMRKDSGFGSPVRSLRLYNGLFQSVPGTKLKKTRL